MTGSVAEERIRARVEAVLRGRFPDARIVHELVLDQGGVRIDLAAVTPDRLVVAEIKSERDVLKRLRAQVETAVEVAQEVWVFVAQKHAAALATMTEQHLWRPLYGPPGLREQGGWHNPEPRGRIDNPAWIAALQHCWLRVEPVDDDALNFEPLPGCGYGPRGGDPCHDPRKPLQMLWREELAWLTGPMGAGPRASRQDMIRLAVEHLSGKEVRRGVCRMLRRRSFPRADLAVAA